MDDKEMSLPAHPDWRARRAYEIARRASFQHEVKQHSQNRRCFGVDYRGRNIYMFTLRIAPGIPHLSIITPMRDEAGLLKADVSFTETGRIVQESLSVLKGIPLIAVSEESLMPDHVHLVVYVMDKLKRAIGNYLSGFMAGCTTRYQRLLKSRGIGFKGSFFEENFNDRVCLRKGQYLVFKNYVRDNYRRRALIMANPQYFQRVWGIEFMSLTLSIYGNPFLLLHPEREVVRWSSRFSDEEKERRRNRLLDISKNGGVIVSPFINEHEQNLRDECLTLGARMIHVIWQGFPKIYKPSKSEFELCAAGRLLLVAMHPGVPGQEKLTREMAMAMNQLAEQLCDYTLPFPHALS